MTRIDEHAIHVTTDDAQPTRHAAQWRLLYTRREAAHRQLMRLWAVQGLAQSRHLSVQRQRQFVVPPTQPKPSLGPGSACPVGSRRWRCSPGTLWPSPLARQPCQAPAWPGHNLVASRHGAPLPSLSPPDGHTSLTLAPQVATLTRLGSAAAPLLWPGTNPWPRMARRNTNRLALPAVPFVSIRDRSCCLPLLWLDANRSHEWHEGARIALHRLSLAPTTHAIR